MNGFMICFGIVGIIACVFAIVVLAIFSGSFIVVAIKSFKESCKQNTEVYKEHIGLLADARRARLQKKREQIINRKNAKADKKLAEKEKKILLEDKKAEAKDKLKEAKYQANLANVNKKIERANSKKAKVESVETTTESKEVEDATDKILAKPEVDELAATDSSVDTTATETATPEPVPTEPEVKGVLTEDVAPMEHETTHQETFLNED